MKPGDAASLAKYVVQQAPKYRLDPNAVIAVAIQEGISGKIGDNGTSFGPWQLHQGGAYPAGAPQSAQAANEWAWSPAGVNYALGRMSSVAGGLKGRAAVHAIVYSFERPTNPAAEYAAAVQALPSNDGGTGGHSSILDSINSAATSVVPGLGAAESVVGGASSAVSSAEAVGSFLGSLTQASFWVRALEVIGGGILLFVGIYLLARQVGLAPSATQVARAGAMATPQGRALAAGGTATGAAEKAAVGAAT